MRILITAFEPFGREKVNTSAEVLQLLPETISGHKARKLLLPVVFGLAAGIVQQEPADLIFLLGEAGGRSAVTPETTARNIRDARIPDNGGNRPEREKILPDGPDIYTTRIPAEEITERMRKEGFQIEISHDAGSFVCNDTFYLTGILRETPVDFIHVPHRTEHLQHLAKTVGRFIELAAEKLNECAQG